MTRDLNEYRSKLGPVEFECVCGCTFDLRKETTEFICTCRREFKVKRTESHWTGRVLMTVDITEAK